MTAPALDGRWRRSVLALFFVNGASFSSWFPRLPEIRERLDLSLSALGAVLVAIGLGGLLASVVAGAVVDRIGSRRAAVTAMTILGAGLPFLGVAPSPLVLAASLAVLSAVDALADVAMNVQAAEVQRTTDRSVIQRFHAAWSIGAVAGAGTGTAAAASGLGLGAHLAITGVVLAALSLWSWSGLAPGLGTPDDAPAGSRRRLPAVALLAATALTVAVVEGAPGDWAAVFASDVHGASDGVAGLGYVAVSLGMVAGRLVGDRATDRLGAPRLLVVALGVVAVGLMVVVTSPAASVAVAGFLVTGCGISVLFPALYLQAATTPGVPPGLGVGVMTSGARLGFLASPPAIGALSEATSLRVGLAVVVGAAVATSGFLAAANRRFALSRAGGP